MPKLNQIVAVVSGQKTRAEKEFGDLNKIVQKHDLFNGLSRTYQPLEEGGEQFPAEGNIPQKSATEIVNSVKGVLTRIINAVATQEIGNTGAKADVIVGGHVIVKDAPVTVLLYLEKQLTDLNTFVGNFPVLDPSETWKKNEQDGQYKTEPTKTVKTKKVQKALVLYPHSEQHPAQTQLVTEDVTVGHWTTVKSATVFSAKDKQGIIGRIQELLDAVRVAREEANSIDVKQQLVAEPVLKYIFG